MISVLIGPVVFIAFFLINSYREGLPDGWTWLDFFDPWFLGFLTSSFLFGFLAVWIVYGMAWAVYEIILLKRNFRINTRSKNLNITTVIISLLLGPGLFVIDTSLYGMQSEHWFVVGVGQFVYASVLGFIFTWFIYGLVRWIILPSYLWIAKVFAMNKK